MPRIGLLSDSHGRAETTGRAVRLLAERGAELLLHLGDLGTAAVIDQLVPTDTVHESRLVFGNTDGDADALGRYAAGLGIIVEHPIGQVNLEGERVLRYTHGDNAVLMRNALAQQPAYLCHGHTHHPRDDRYGVTRVINPGALFRAARYTVALLDTDADALTFLPVT